MTLSDYTLTGEVLAFGEILIERGQRTADGAPVLIKHLRGEYPSPREIARLRFEHTITRELDLPGVVRARAIVRTGNAVALVLDDPGGRPLAEALRAGPIGLEPVLRVTAAIAKTLSLVHRRGIVHRDINPANVLVDLEAGTVALTGFGIAARVPGRTSPDVVEGALAYMSPEQTGRTGRPLDHRADFYSLGVTLYEALTGVLPFPATDPVELVHAHLARMCTPPRELRPEIPEVVSGIVMKLLAKGAEDRYQSAAGLEADLEECLQKLGEGAQADPDRGPASAGRSIPPFPLGRHEAPGRLGIPARLQGRDAELAQLLSTWEGCRSGAVELVLIEGPEGIGKSTLLADFRGAVERQGGYFVAGTFLEPGRSPPHGALLEAFRELCLTLLAESRLPSQRWDEVLSAALWPNGQVLADALPELSLLVGPLPEVQELAPEAALNRFHLTFQSFVRAFLARPNRLVLCLDDLDQADPASLELLSLLMMGVSGGSLLVLGACRSATEPLARAIEALRAAGVAASTLALGPIGRPAVIQLLVDTLACDEARAAPLADLFLARTGGNPLSVRQLLETLHEGGQIAYDPHAGGFAWDLAAVQETVFTEDAAAFTEVRLRRLSLSTQRALGFAACIGRRFDAEALTLLDGHPAAEVLADLGEAAREGFVLRIDLPTLLQDAADQRAPTAGIVYEFAHDRVQQAAAALIDGDARQEAHLALARRAMGGGDLSGATGVRGAAGLSGGALDAGDVSDEALFAAARHGNLAAPRIDDTGERLTLARWDLAAGKRARSRGAIEAAAGYLEAGVLLLGELGWTEAYDLTFALHLELAECEHLAGRAARSEALFAAAQGRACSPVDQARVEHARVSIYTLFGQAAEAIEAGRRGLLLLGIDVGDTEEARQKVMKTALAELEMRIGSHPIESLIDAPEMTDPTHRAALQLLVSLHGPALLMSPTLAASSMYTQVNLSLQHGHSELSTYGYMAYGRTLARTSRRYPEAYAFGKLALDLDARFKNASLRCKLNYFFGTFLHLMEPLRSVLLYFMRAIDAGIESGDLQYASFACCHAMAIRLALGDDLHEIEEQTAQFAVIVARTRDPLSPLLLALGRQMVKNLAGATLDRRTLSDGAFDERELAAMVAAPNVEVAQAFYHTIKLELLFLHGDYEGALKEAKLAEQRDSSIQGMQIATELSFYAALTAAMLEAPRTSPARSRRPTPLDDYAQRIEIWADDCPANFRHKHLLVAAERARLAGDEVDAMAFYDEAIDAARDNDFPRDEALANELCARFHLHHERYKIARGYMTDAYYGYLRWGATAKADDIAREHPDLLLRTAAVAGAGSGVERAELLDVAMVVRAARALAEEIVLDRVLARLMQIVLESAGAQRGVLLLDHDGRLAVEASIEADTGVVELTGSQPAEDSTEIPLSIVHLVARTQAPVVLGDAVRGGRFSSDPYIAGSEPRSLLCIPLTHQGGLAGILYLENNAARDAFSPARIELLRTISSQAAIAIRNALLYARVQAVTDELLQANEGLEAEVTRRTEQLSEAKQRLEAELVYRANAERERAALQEEVIRVQRARLQELSTPLMPITDRVMVLPLMGAMDTERAQQVLETALGGARRNRTLVMILDVTGVKGVDAGVASMLVRTVETLSILGTEAVITGIRPEVARMIVGLGLDLGGVTILSTLQRGIAYALARAEGDPRSLRSGWLVTRGGPTP